MPTVTPTAQERLQNHYVKISLGLRGDAQEVYLHLGTVTEQENSAAFLVELLDWAGNIDSVTSRRDRLGLLEIAQLSYVSAHRAVEITENEFAEGVITAVINQAREELTTPSDGAYLLKFKRNKDRYALLRYIQDNALRVGLTI